MHVCIALYASPLSMLAKLYSKITLQKELFAKTDILLMYSKKTTFLHYTKICLVNMELLLICSTKYMKYTYKDSSWLYLGYLCHAQS